jgi:hypothetical protein
VNEWVETGMESQASVEALTWIYVLSVEGQVFGVELAMVEQEMKTQPQIERYYYLPTHYLPACLCIRRRQKEE